MASSESESPCAMGLVTDTVSGDRSSSRSKFSAVPTQSKAQYCTLGSRALARVSNLRTPVE